MKAAIFIIIGCIVLVAFSCSNEGDGFLSRLLKGKGNAVPVMVESVTASDKSVGITAPAKVEPVESTDVSFPSDITVEKIFVAEGSAVSAGDALFSISEQDLSSQLARKRTDLKEAKSNLDKNNYFLKNRDRLFEEGRIDKNQYDNLESEVRASEAAFEKIQQEITKAEDLSRNNIVQSPTGGIVSKIYTPPGNTQIAGKTVMAISRPDPITISFKLLSQNAAAVKPGMIIKVRFLDLNGETTSARVTSVGTELDQTTGTFPVRAILSNPTGRYKSGMQAEASFTSSESQRVFLISENALIHERMAYFVYTVSDGKARKVQVIPNETSGSKVEIIRGLAEGDIVVVKGSDKLTDGTVVDIWKK